MKHVFRAPAWAWLVTGGLLALLLGLGSWQVRRAHEKEGMQASYVAAVGRAPLGLTGDSPAPPGGQVIAAEAEGQYVGERQLLLDNQSHQGQPGYRVWTPLRLASGGLIVVDRGWVPADPQRTVLPDLSVTKDTRNVRGLWRDLPRPGLELANANPRAPATYPAIVEYPTAPELQALVREPVAPGILLLDSGEKDGFVRNWNPATEFPPSRHYAYAAQWFALAATLLVIFIRMNIKNRT